MKHSQEAFLDLVKEAYNGDIQLPAFQREWKWERGKVISLYDSLRKQFPIGNFLLLKTPKDINFSPRPFEGCHKNNGSEKLALDGQQRLTAGIALLHGLGGNLRYFIDLNRLKELSENQKINLDNEEDIRNFVQDIDDGDNYLYGTTKKSSEEELLLENHLISTRHLIAKTATQRQLEAYEKKYPEMSNFLKYVFVPHFTLDNNFQCPVITLDENESLTAITRIFATINTTGKRLTPIEIVTAILYANEINLKEEVQAFQAKSDYLENMDKNGEVLLQTIALFSNETPKKSLLPKTITYLSFKAWYQEALQSLDDVGNFLTTRMGVGFNETDKLIPYDSILAPMAKVFKDTKNYKGAQKGRAIDCLEKWFVGSSLSQRYQEGVHNKQQKDVEDILNWIDAGDEYMPAWLKETTISPSMKSASPSGAIGRLLRCLMNRAEPIDPVDGIQVGYYENAHEPSQDHHIWPRKFCIDHVPNWNQNLTSSDVVLNIAPISAKTNKSWDKMDPANQVAQFEHATPNGEKQKQVLERLMLNDKCIEILKRPNKSKSDYDEFINERFIVFSKLLTLWGFGTSNNEFDDAVDSD